MTEHRHGPLWVFACRSWMGQTGFSHVESRVTMIRDYHRAFCLYSFEYQDT